VAVVYTAGERYFRGVATTLSGGGLFLTHIDGLELGDETSLFFRPARHLPLIQANARVRYIVAEKGAAVEFTEISVDDRHRLLRLVHRKTGDRRLQRRTPLATQVHCAQHMLLAYSRDISLCGMFIETTTPFPVGSPLIVRFNLDNKDRVVKAAAVVSYQVQKMGMGIFFTEIEPHDRDAVQEYMESEPALPKTEWPLSRAA
jgi:c-di-GMP-binding flagellar brake protein YcgR